MLKAVVFDTATNLMDVSDATNPELVWPSTTVIAGATLGVGQLVGVVDTGGVATGVLASPATYVSGSPTTAIPAAGFVLASYTATQTVTIFVNGIYTATVAGATIASIGSQVYLSLLSPGNPSLTPPTPSNSWAAATHFSLGQTILDTNGKWEIVTAAGTTGSVEPTNWSVSGGTTNDGGSGSPPTGGVTWTNIATPLEQVVGTILNYAAGLCTITFYPFTSVGGVESVALAAPSDLSVAGSPVISVGTLVLAWNNQAPNTFKAGPASGGSGATLWRGIVTADLFNAPASGSAIGAIKLANDLGGTAASPTVIGIQSVAVSSTPPGLGQVLTATSATTSTWQTPTGGSGGGSYNVTAGTSITVTSAEIGSPATDTFTVSLTNTAVTAGSYTNANITVNAQGQITAASNGTSGGGGGGGGSSNVVGGTGISVTSTDVGSPPVDTFTVTIANTAVTAGSYTNSNITVNAQGQITAASNGAGGGVTSVNSLIGALTFTGTNITVTPSGTTVALSLPTTAVTAGSYTNSSITVDAEGRLTSASSGTSSTVGTVALTAQTASIALVNLVASPTTTALYALNFYMTTTSVGYAGTALLTLWWNDGTAQNYATATIDLTAQGGGSFISGTVVVKCVAGAIQYSTTVTGAAGGGSPPVGTPQYSLDIRAVLLG